MMNLYWYKKDGPMDEFFIKSEGRITKVDDLTQVIEILGAATFLGQIVEREEFTASRLTVWTIR